MLQKFSKRVGAVAFRMRLFFQCTYVQDCIIKAVYNKTESIVYLLLLARVRHPKVSYGTCKNPLNEIMDIFSTCAEQIYFTHSMEQRPI